MRLHSDMMIRRATPADLPDLMRIVRKAVPLMRASGNLQWDDTYPNEEVFRHDIERSLLWVAEMDRFVVGVVAITSDSEPDYILADWDHDEPALVIHRLAVDPDFQGQGVARTLMNKAEELAREQGIPVVRVDTNIENRATQKLFPSLGYRFAGEISLRIRPDQRFLCYEKRLLFP